LGWQVLDARKSGGPAPAESVSSSPSTPTEVSRQLRVASVSVSDPHGDGQENDELAALAIDHDPATAWTTSTYTRPDLGGLKDGVGLVLDLGAVRRVSGVTVRLTGRGTNLQVGTSTRPGLSPDHFRTVASAERVSDRVVFRLDPTLRARYVMVWITRLPAVPGGYQAGIAEVSLRS
jgi:hypothetical protein